MDCGKGNYLRCTAKNRHARYLGFQRATSVFSAKSVVPEVSSSFQWPTSVAACDAVAKRGRRKRILTLIWKGIRLCFQTSGGARGNGHWDFGKKKTLEGQSSQGFYKERLLFCTTACGGAGRVRRARRAERWWALARWRCRGRRIRRPRSSARFHPRCLCRQRRF